MKRAWALLAATAAVYATVLAWAAWQLPGREVALHVNPQGVVNRYGSRQEALSMFIGIGTFVLGLAAAVLCAVRWTPMRLWNIPYKDYWSNPRRSPRLRRMLAEDLALMFSLPVLFLGFVVADIVLTTLDPDGHSSLWMAVAVGLLLVGTALCIARMLGPRYRPRRDD